MRKIKKLTTVKVSNGNEIIKSEVIYNVNQEILSHINYDDFGSIETKIEFEFDEKGNCIKETNFYDEESVSETIINTYNENNKLTKSVTEYGDGSISIKSVVPANGNNEQIIETRDEDGVLESREVNIYDNDLLLKHLIYDEDNKLVRESVNEFNENQNIVKRIEIDYLEKQELLTTFEYNEKNNLIKFQKATQKGNIVEKLFLSYDEQDRVIEQKYSDGVIFKYIYDDVNKSRIEERYDSNGYLRMKVFFDLSDGEIITNEDFVVYKVEYNYEYFD